MSIQAATDSVGSVSQEERALRLLKNIATAANMARSMNEAFVIAGDEILDYTGWFGSAIFLVDKCERLSMVAVHGPINEHLERLGPAVKQLLATTWEAGTGLPGRVLVSKQPEWATDEDCLREPEKFPNAAAAVRMGVKCLMAFPVMSLDRVGGVLAFFALERFQPDSALLDLMSDVGVQLGRALERDTAAEKHRILAQRLSTIIESMPSGLIAVDQDSRVIEWNHEAANLTKVSAARAAGYLLADILPLPTEVSDKIHQAAHGRRIRTDSPIRHEIDSGARLLELTIYPLCLGKSDGAAIRLDDITRRTQMEQLIVHSEKMLSVGGLAAGVAHEINNPLAGMVQNAQVAQSRVLSDSPANHTAAEKNGTTLNAVRGYLQDRHVMEMLEAIRASGARAADIIRAMMGFTQANSAEMTRCDLKRVIDQAVELAASDFEMRKQCDFTSVKVTRDYADDLPKVQCHSTEIQQVMLNLLKNAAQAAAEQKDRALPLQMVLRLSRDGNTIRLDVEDDGPGMTDAARRRAFEPFFTTKDPNIGTGLGLSVSYYIITQNHHGQMTCAARRGGGTVFSIVLPIEQPIEHII